MRRTVAHTLARIAACGALACLAAAPAPASAAEGHAPARTSVINTLTAAANALTRRDYPYVWAGGHGQAGTPSVGTKGPGYNGHRKGFDCSGSVAAVLAGASVWQPGSPVPGDAWVIKQLLGEHLIARGPGTGSAEVTLYDHPGVHIFMDIDGRYFGTGANKHGGPGWLGYVADGPAPRGYKRYHLLFSALSRTGSP